MRRVARNKSSCRTGFTISGSPSTALGLESTISAMLNGNTSPSKLGISLTRNVALIWKSRKTSVPLVSRKSAPSSAGTPGTSLDWSLPSTSPPPPPPVSPLSSGIRRQNLTEPISNGDKSSPPRTSKSTATEPVAPRPRVTTMVAMPSVSEVINALVAKRNSPDSLPPMTIVDAPNCPTTRPPAGFTSVR